MHGVFANGIATLNSRRRKGDYVIDYIMMDRAHRDAFRVDGAWLVEERKASDHAPLVGLIGLEGPGDRVPLADSWQKCPAWEWMPMASNIQMVFYRKENDRCENYS